MARCAGILVGFIVALGGCALSVDSESAGAAFGEPEDVDVAERDDPQRSAGWDPCPGAAVVEVDGVTIVIHPPCAPYPIDRGDPPDEAASPAEETVRVAKAAPPR